MAIREKVWTCSFCGRENLGRHKECPTGCGAARDKDSLKSAKSQGTAGSVTDPELLKLARAGADWFCSHCGAGNIGTSEACLKCSSPRYGVSEENHSEDPNGHARFNASQKSPPPLPSPNPSKCQVPPRYSEPEDVYPVKREPLISSTTLLIGGGVGAGILLIGAVIWAFQTHEVTGSVSSMTWSRTTHIEKWAPTRTRLWKAETTERSEISPIKGSGAVAGFSLIEGSCAEEYHHTIQVECGSHPECKDITRTEQEEYACTKPQEEKYACTKPEDYICGEDCIDMHNGFEHCNPKHCTRDVPDTCTRTIQVPDTCKRPKEVFDHQECITVIDYCDKKINQTRCSYNTQAWMFDEGKTVSGSGIENLAWAAVSLRDDQRASYSASYLVTVSYVDDGETQTYGFPTKVSMSSKIDAENAASDYLSWNVGMPAYVMINNMGGISGEPYKKDR